jgi:hypothetical protein
MTKGKRERVGGQLPPLTVPTPAGPSFVRGTPAEPVPEGAAPNAVAPRRRRRDFLAVSEAVVRHSWSTSRVARLGACCGRV